MITRDERMQRWLTRFCVTDQAARRQAVLDTLHEIGRPYTLYHEDPHGVVNIGVTLQPGAPRLVIGAHYDSVAGSTGANDNGAAVCILLEFLRSAPRSGPLEVVFFDQEERQMRGSEAYVRRFPAHDILGMINLDLCGVGDCIVFGPHSHTVRPPFAPALQQIGPHPTATAELMPPSDDMLFEYARIPALSVCASTADDVEAIQELAHAMYSHSAPAKVPAFMDTMHNSPRDSIDVVDVQAMVMVLAWLTDLVAAMSQNTL